MSGYKRSKQQDDTVSIKSIADAHKTWTHAKKAVRKQHRRYARQVLENLVEKAKYVPWSEDKKIDFVLVYEPIKEYMNKVLGTVEPDPRPMDLDDVAELKRVVAEEKDNAEKKEGKKIKNPSKMRVEYINLLRVNGLEVEIENFCSKFVEYRAIKICGTDFAMDTWAEKFRLMKPVEPPFGAVLDINHDKAVDKLIAMYNETLYQLPTPDIDMSDAHLFEPSKYVPQTMKMAVKNVMGRFRAVQGNSNMRMSPIQECETDAEDKAAANRAEKERKYKESEAFKQLTFQNERYGSLWTTRFQNLMFNILHGNGKDERLYLAKDSLVARAIRAPFEFSKKSKFLGHEEPEFYNSSERSLMVFRILENPGEKLRDDDTSLKLKDMYREDCFQAAFPLHAGGYKIGLSKTRWSDINIQEQIDNPRKLLRYFWSTSHMKWRYQPLNIVRNYFGSVTAMYFAYFGFYNMTLVFPAVVGGMVFIYGIGQMFTSESVNQVCESGKKYLMCADCYIDGTCEPTYLSDYCFTTRITSAANNGAVIVFSILMMIWMALFVAFWKRQQNTIAHTWGTTNSRSASAEVRVKYTLTKTKEFRFNIVTGKREHHVTFLHRLPQYAIAFTIVALFLSVALLLTLTITVYNYSLSLSLQRAKSQNAFTRKYANEIANCITGCISATLIICLSYVYRIIANKLTNLENHRTQRDHDNHLSFKIYLFEFVNYYGTLFYIAFIKGNVSSPGTPRYLFGGNQLKFEGCAPGGCMSEVSIQMIIIMSIKQLVPILKDIIRTLNLNRIQEDLKIMFLSPFVSCFEIAELWVRKAKENLKRIKNDQRPQFVQDFELTEPTEMYQEYINNIIQLGFLTMFVTAFPLAPLICLFINLWQLRQDATRYVKRVRRPIGFRSEGIGTWINILEVLSRIAILVNAILIAVTFDWLPIMIYNRFYGSGTETDEESEHEGYVDFMLASHTFTHADNTTQTCRYWSYFHPARDDQTRFWLELMLARMLFIFFFQNVVWAAVRIIELVCDSTPKFVQERMVLEERIAHEWLSSDEESDGEDEDDGEDSRGASVAETLSRLRKPTLSKRHSPTDEVVSKEESEPLLNESESE